MTYGSLILLSKKFGLFVLRAIQENGKNTRLITRTEEDVKNDKVLYVQDSFPEGIGVLASFEIDIKDNLSKLTDDLENLLSPMLWPDEDGLEKHQIWYVVDAYGKVAIQCTFGESRYQLVVDPQGVLGAKLLPYERDKSLMYLPTMEDVEYILDSMMGLADECEEVEGWSLDSYA